MHNAARWHSHRLVRAHSRRARVRQQHSVPSYMTRPARWPCSEARHRARRRMRACSAAQPAPRVSEAGQMVPRPAVGRGRSRRSRTLLAFIVDQSEERSAVLDDDGEIRQLLQLIDDEWQPPDLRLRIHLACQRRADVLTYRFSCRPCGPASSRTQQKVTSTALAGPRRGIGYDEADARRMLRAGAREKGVDHHA
jgi:hypothetical protein